MATPLQKRTSSAIPDDLKVVTEAIEKDVGFVRDRLIPWPGPSAAFRKITAAVKIGDRWRFEAGFCYWLWALHEEITTADHVKAKEFRKHTKRAKKLREHLEGTIHANVNRTAMCWDLLPEAFELVNACRRFERAASERATHFQRQSVERDILDCLVSYVESYAGRPHLADLDTLLPAFGMPANIATAHRRKRRRGGVSTGPIVDLNPHLYDDRPFLMGGLPVSDTNPRV